MSTVGAKGGLRAERLRLRPFTPDDVDVFLAYRSDPDTLHWLGSQVPPTSESALAAIDGFAALGGPTPDHWYRYAVELDGQLIGDVSTIIRSGGGIAQIGYVLDPRFRGSGYAAEAAGALVDHLIDQHGVRRIEASLAPENVASMRLVEAIGMEFECVARLALDRDGELEDVLRYAMTDADRRVWLSRPRSRPEVVELVELEPDEAYLWGRLATHYSERRFVATMPLTWRDALFPETFEGAAAVPWMRGVLADDERAAFVMLSLTHGHSEGWYLWRLLVDRRHQRRGIGSMVLDRLVADVLRPAGVPRLYTSFVDGPGTPRPFYLGYGFTLTGRDIDGEAEAVLELG